MRGTIRLNNVLSLQKCYSSFLLNSSNYVIHSDTKIAQPNAEIGHSPPPLNCRFSRPSPVNKASLSPSPLIFSGLETSATDLFLYYLAPTLAQRAHAFHSRTRRSTSPQRERVRERERKSDCSYVTLTHSMEKRVLRHTDPALRAPEVYIYMYGPRVYVGCQASE